MEVITRMVTQPVFLGVSVFAHCPNFRMNRCSGKEHACQCRKLRRFRFDPWVRKIPWSGKWQPVLVFLPGKFHGQKSLPGYSPWGRKELDMTEHTHNYPFYSQKCVLAWIINYIDILIIPNNNHWAQWSQMSCFPFIPGPLALSFKKQVLNAPNPFSYCRAKRS